jgi:hypothetical protein
VVMAVVMDQARCRTASNQCEEQSPCGITALRAEFAAPPRDLQLASVFTALAFLALIRVHDEAKHILPCRAPAGRRAARS